MSKLKRNKQSILLLLAVVIGALAGIFLKDKVEVVKPLGDIFINLIFMIMPLLIFFSIASCVLNMKEQKRLKKVIITAFIIFILMSIISTLIGLLSLFTNIRIEQEADMISGEELTHIETQTNETNKNVFEQVANIFTVSDFSKLWNRENMIALITFSLLFGIATLLTKEKGKAVKEFLISGNEIIMKFVSIIMYYAPIGLGCYFANIVANIGGSIIIEYIKILVIYMILAGVMFFGIYSVIILFIGGKGALKDFWKQILPTAIMALSTGSSAITIPINIQACKRIGIPEDIAELVIPLGINVHKDGSTIGAVLKIVFLFALCGKLVIDFPTILGIIGVTLVVSLLMGAVPGAGLASEMLILTIYGFPASLIGVITIIGNLIDAPGAVLNSVGNTVAAMLTTRIVDGKNVMRKEEVKNEIK